jgi:hypothetical protein
MNYQVIAAFIDKRNGQQIEPGSPVPNGLDRETIQRLVAANCLRPAEGEETPASEPGGDGADEQSQGQPGGEGDAPGAGQPAGGRRGRRAADTGSAQ